MTKKNIYHLDLHEISIVNDGNLFTKVMRVPGGFIYTSYDKSHNIMSSVFVPLDYEYKTVESK